ncbi:LUD domain-containing protein [Candidatus Pacearchaeota archaeon]|nr:LUD domain-containing protein [Candidatus Pacearchaeota archaeon]
MINKIKEKWSKPADKIIVERTISALKNSGIESAYFENAESLKEHLFKLIPENAEVMTMTSVTLDKLGITREINETKIYSSVRNKMTLMNREEQHLEMQKLGTAPQYTVGSVHAVTEDGKVLIASNTGSQLPAYAYGSSRVILVVGTQKIVKDLNEGFKRIYKYTLPLESERAKKAYGVDGSFVSKLLIINKEVTPGRITILFLNENIGF